MLDLYDKIEDACRFLQDRWGTRPHAGVILGTGLGGFASQMQVEYECGYDEIPHFVTSTATGHTGRLLCGRVGDVPIMAMEGRFHLYEGYPLKLVTLPVRVFQAMGANLLAVTNAVGGMNANYALGDLVCIDDHINLMGDNPLIGINDDRLGTRFPDMSAPYDRGLGDVALTTARQGDFVCHRGVLAAVSGPCLETRAEYRFLRQVGADTVGMSTVPEAIVANHARHVERNDNAMKCFGLSVVTDLCLPDALEVADVASIIAVAEEAGPRLQTTLQAVLNHDFAGS